TKETHDYWKREYDRFLQKKQLETKLDVLKRELLWARIHKRKEALTHLQTRIESKLRSQQLIENKIQELAEIKKKRQAKFDELNLGRTELEGKRIEAVKEATTHEVNLEWATNLLRDFQPLDTENPNHTQFESINKVRQSWTTTVEQSQKSLAKAKEKTASLSEKMADISGRLEDALTRLIDTNVEYEVSAFKKKLLSEEIADPQAQVRLAREEI